ncbi:murein biosynthesis integral membrane protein MurJ [Elioraea sp.]|uniref:murein biosynthesis integral membrane protein MurJ n=1 Tax=Elioraea sp. TaxID=2185103 RepID=UPI0025B90E16|nr:murein biosynthesis integral membrane protein MurJ [Elioraea sp.]
MIKSIITVGAWTALSRILGFVRDIAIAARIGAGPEADAFFVALKLPNFFRRLFGEGAFAAAFVPMFAGSLAGEGREAARRVAEGALAVMVATLAALTLAAIVFMPQAMMVLAPGFVRDPERFALAVELTRITFPYLLLICVVALLSGVLNGLDRFAAAAGAPVLFNLFLIAGLFAAPVIGIGAVHGLAWGVAASGIAQLVLLAVAVGAAGMQIRLPRPRLSPEVRALLRRMVPGAIGAGVTQINLMIDVIIASLLPQGAIAFLYFADRVAQLPLGVIGTAVGTALLPVLSRQVRAGEDARAGETQNRAVEFALLLTLPAAAGLIACAGPIIAVLFERGAFGAVESAATAAALAAYGVGLPAFVLVKVFAPGFFARGDTATPVKIAVGCVALNLALNLALIGPFAHVGIALATGIAAWVNAGLLALLLVRQGRWRADARLASRAVRITLAAAAMGCVLWAARVWLFDALFELRGIRWPALAALLALGGVVFAALALAFRAADVGEIRGYLRRRGR